MIQYLKELVGDYNQAIIVNGKLLTQDGKNIYCKKNRHSVVFVSKDYNGTEIEHDSQKVNTMLHEMLARYDAAPIFDSSQDVIVKVCKVTNVIVMKSAAYVKLTELAEHPENNMSTSLSSLLTAYMQEEVLNYLEIYTRILKPKLSRITATIFKAHLVQDLFIPIMIYTNDIRSPLNFMLFRAYLDPLLARGKQLKIKSTDAMGLHVDVIAGCTLADILGIPVVPFQPEMVMLSILHRMCQLFGDAELLRNFAERYAREFTYIYPSNPDAAVSAKMQIRQQYYTAIQETPIFVLS